MEEFSGFLFILFIIVLLVFNLSKKTEKSKYVKTNLVLELFSLIMIMVLCMFPFSSFIESEEKNVVADGFTIEGYKVKLNVNENNIVDVEEEITVDFFESDHHGIYKYIKNNLEYTGKNNKTITREAKILKLKAIGDEYSVSDNGNESNIKIGSPDYVLDPGLKTYNITYQYDMGSDPYIGFDEFIFHSFGDNWGTSINDASLEITMPKSIDEDSIKFFSDKYRKNDITSHMKYYVIGNTLYARVLDNYDLKKALTVDIELPEDYFLNNEPLNETDNKNVSVFNQLLIILPITILIFMIIFVLWSKYGKDFIITDESNNYYPPEGYDAASIGYFLVDSFNVSFRYALIIELANKGLIKIEESKEEIENKSKNKFLVTVTNLCPAGTNNVAKQNMTPNEKLVYEHLFRNGDINILANDEKIIDMDEKIQENLLKLDEIKDDIKSYKKQLLGAILLSVSTVLLSTTIDNIVFGFNISTILYFLDLILIIIMFILTILMTRESKYGKKITTQIKKFYTNIQALDKEQIDKLVKENPNYFYDVLPYVFVLGITRKFVKKFDNVSGSKTILCDRDLIESLSTSIYPYHMYDYYSSSSSGGGGGGCSSCGGGGSW